MSNRRPLLSQRLRKKWSAARLACRSQSSDHLEQLSDRRSPFVVVGVAASAADAAVAVDAVAAAAVVAVV